MRLTLPERGTNVLLPVRMFWYRFAIVSAADNCQDGCYEGRFESRQHRWSNSARFDRAAFERLCLPRRSVPEIKSWLGARLHVCPYFTFVAKIAGALSACVFP